ncbi:MAG: branched-chain alpha-keto acid dehydrogenase subunit E2, partial [Paracoccaceae bacterium]
MMWKHIVANFLTITILGLMALAAVAGWGRNQYSGPGPLVSPICLKVESGTTFRKLAGKLEEQGAITWPYIFKVGVDYSGRSKALKAGSYLVPAGASMNDIVMIVTGAGVSTCGAEINYRIGVTGTDIRVSAFDPATEALTEVMTFDPAAGELPADYAQYIDDQDVRLRVTVAEGVTSWQVVNALNGAAFLTGEIKDIPGEGMLAPQQYEVARGSDRGALIAKM